MCLRTSSHKSTLAKVPIISHSKRYPLSLTVFLWFQCEHAPMTWFLPAQAQWIHTTGGFRSNAQIGRFSIQNSFGVNTLGSGYYEHPATTVIVNLERKFSNWHRCLKSTITPSTAHQIKFLVASMTQCQVNLAHTIFVLRHKQCVKCLQTRGGGAKPYVKKTQNGNLLKSKC